MILSNELFLIKTVCDIYISGTYDAPNTNRNSRASQSLIVIVASPPSNPRYADFHKAVNYYNEQPPFNFPNPLKYPKSVSLEFSAVAEPGFSGGVVAIPRRGVPQPVIYDQFFPEK